MKTVVANVRRKTKYVSTQRVCYYKSEHILAATGYRYEPLDIYYFLIYWMQAYLFEKHHEYHKLNSVVKINGNCFDNERVSSK